MANIPSYIPTPKSPFSSITPMGDSQWAQGIRDRELRMAVSSYNEDAKRGGRRALRSPEMQDRWAGLQGLAGQESAPQTGGLNSAPPIDDPLDQMKRAQDMMDMFSASPPSGSGSATPTPVPDRSAVSSGIGIPYSSPVLASSLLDRVGTNGEPPGMITNPQDPTGPLIPGAKTGYMQGYKTGGLIDGPPPPPDGSDNVDIKAKAGEYVLPPEAVELLGLETLDRIVMAATGRPPVHGGTPTEDGEMGFAQGGLPLKEDQFKPQSPPIPVNAPAYTGSRLVSDAMQPVKDEMLEAWNTRGSNNPGMRPQIPDAPAAFPTQRDPGRPTRPNERPLAGWLEQYNRPLPYAPAAPVAKPAGGLNATIEEAKRDIGGLTVDRVASGVAGAVGAIPRAVKSVVGDFGSSASSRPAAAPQQNTPAPPATPQQAEPPVAEGGFMDRWRARVAKSPTAILNQERDARLAARRGEAPTAQPGGESSPSGSRANHNGPAIGKRRFEQTPSDNVQGSGVYGKDSAGNQKQIYVNRFAPGTKEYAEYGAGIISDSRRGATKQGFDADYAKTGNYVGDPATGQGMPLPPTVGQGARMGLGELSPQETQAVMMGYGPARQAGLQAMQDNANLELMRQWRGQDLTNAPQEVRDLYGKPAGLDTLIERYIADTTSPEGQARRMAHEQRMMAMKAAGAATVKQKSPAEVQNQWLDAYFPKPDGENPEQTTQKRAWAGTMANKISAKTQLPPQVLYPALAETAMLPMLEEETPEAYQARQMMALSKSLGVDLRAVLGP